VQVSPQAVGVGPVEQSLERRVSPFPERDRRDADAIRLEHVVGMFRLLGGAPEHGGMGPLPQTQFAVLPAQPISRFSIGPTFSCLS
jgi:hypothetical protein